MIVHDAAKYLVMREYRGGKTVHDASGIDGGLTAGYIDRHFFGFQKNL